MQIIRYSLAWFLSLVLAFTPVISAQAAMVDNGMLLEDAATTHTRDSLQEWLARDDARQQLQALGVNPAWAQERARTLSDAELARINHGIGELQAGGDSVLGVLVLIFIVFIITDAIGATDIFPFVHPVN